MEKYHCSRCQKYKTEEEFSKVVKDDTPELRDKYHSATVHGLVMG